MTALRVAAAATLMATVATACSSGTSHPAATTTATTTATTEATTPPRAATRALSPVEVLHRITGCVVTPGETQGITDVYGARYADCLIANLVTAAPGNGDTVTAYTGPQSVLTQELRGATSDDGTKIIVGNGYILSDTGETDPRTGGIVFVTPPANVASMVGGHIL